jgi:hypothetical protein
VHVAGHSPAYVYQEAAPPVVPSGVILLGDGPTLETITASGNCGQDNCAVSVKAGGILDGFSVLCSASSASDGIAAASGGGPNLPAIVRSVKVSRCINAGISAFGSADVGPNVTSTGNATGLESPAGASGPLRVLTGTSGPNAFDANSGNGIDVSGTAVLTFQGGSTHNNAQGIRLAGGGSSSAAMHSISLLDARNNTGSGIVAYAGQYLKLRGSLLLGNGGAGLYFQYSSTGGGALDIGTTASAGGNAFGGTGNLNTKAGVQICSTTSIAIQLGVAGDSFGNCPPTEAQSSCTSGTSSTYSDILYDTTLALAPNVTGCTVGP